MELPNGLSNCVLGTAGLGGVWGKIDEEESIQTILNALTNGISIIDTAPAYGDAEQLVGIALRRWKGTTPAINTKVGRLQSYNAHEGVYDYSTQGMEKSVMNSLDTLGVSVIDTLFLHDPSAILPQEMERVLKQMIQFKKEGYAKKIGLGMNENEQILKHSTGNTFDAIMEFNCLDACCRNNFETILPFYKSQSLDLYIASPLHMGLLGSRFEEYVTCQPNWLDDNSFERAKLLKEIADNHHLTLHSLAHRFLLSGIKDFRIVIGPGDTCQLHETMSDIRTGPLPDNIFEEIINLKKTQKI